MRFKVEDAMLPASKIACFNSNLVRFKGTKISDKVVTPASFNSNLVRFKAPVDVEKVKVFALFQFQFGAI